jgi:predicted negative regulator of RcsB-dependent stress response
MDLEAASLRHAGRLTEARRQLVSALSIAREKQLGREIDLITASLAQTDLLLNDYEAARKSLEEAVARTEATSLDARIALGTTYVRLGEFELAGKQLDAALADIDAQQSAQFIPAVRFALGELAYESGKTADARAHFDKAAALWTDELPDAASVDARSFLGLLDGLARKDPSALRKLQTSVDQAKLMGRLDLETRCRLRLAQFQIKEGRFRDALATLNEIPLEGERVIGREMQAQVHYWRGRALMASGDRAGAASEAALASRITTDLRASLPRASRDRFAARFEIRRMIEQG